MAIRVDDQGYLLDAQGRRLDDSHGNDAASRKKRFDKILADWEKTHGSGAKPPKGTTIMQVEKGDCQWTIAEGAGADPVKTYKNLNEQFSNPHLIHEGDIVFVDKTTQLAVDRHGNANVDVFRDQQEGLAQSGASPQALQAGSELFFSSVPASVKGQVFVMAFEGWPADGAAPPAVAQGRQSLVEGYLNTFPEHLRPAALQQLRDTYDPAVAFDDKDPKTVDDFPDESTSVTYENYNSAIDGAATKLGLPARQPGGAQPPGSTGNPPPANGTGNQPAAVPVDTGGNPVTDPKLLNISTAAAQSGGNPEDKALQGAIADYVNLGSGTPEEVAARLKTLLGTNFGNYDYQINDYVVRHLTPDLQDPLKDLGFQEMRHLVRTYLEALPTKDMQQKALNELLKLPYDDGSRDDKVIRADLEYVADSMGLTAHVSDWDGDVTFVNDEPANEPGAYPGGGQPTSVPVDATGNPINDPQLLNINTAAAQSGGNPNDPNLKNAINDYIGAGKGTPEEIAARVKTLLGVDFGSHDYQVNDYVIRHTSREAKEALDNLPIGSDPLRHFVRTVLGSLPTKEMQQRFLNELLMYEYPERNYFVKSNLEYVADSMDLVAHVSDWTGDVVGWG